MSKGFNNGFEVGFQTGSTGGGSTGESPLATGFFDPPDGVVGVDYLYATSSLFTGGDVDSYDYNGILPAGLSFSTILGWIHGTPLTEETLSGISVIGINVYGGDTTNEADIAISVVDTIAPTVTAFTIPLISNSYTIPIWTFTATDAVGVTGYLITESATPPLAGDVGWSGTAQTSYVVSSNGPYTLYGWAKDAAGNVSSSLNDSCIVELELVGTPIYNTGSAITLSSPGPYYLAEDITSNTDGIILAADNITIDGNFKMLTFGTGNGAEVIGIRSPLFNHRSNIIIKNTNIKHVGTGSECIGISIYGANFTIFNNSIDNATSALFKGIGSTENEHTMTGAYIYNNFIQDRSEVNVQYASGSCIDLKDRTATAYAEVHGNVIVEGHKGIVIQFGLNASPAPSTKLALVYENQVSTNRIGWAKSSYCIASGKGKNIDFYHNRATAKNGRGVTTDGYEGTSTNGAPYNTWTENAIGANYYTTEKPGVPYGDPYENVYGMRCRYASHHWSAINNNVICSSQIVNIVNASYVGSDLLAYEQYMNNLVMTGNTFIANEGIAGATYASFSWQTLDGIVIANNKWQQETDGIKDSFRWVVDAVPAGNDDYRKNVTDDGSSLLADSYTPTTNPAQVTGLVLTKYFDTYILEWDESTALDVWYYEILVDGTPEPQYMYSSKAPHINVPNPFWYDVGRLTAVSYSVKAVTLAGVKSPISATISTVNAIDGWQ